VQQEELTFLHPPIEDVAIHSVRGQIEGARESFLDGSGRESSQAHVVYRIT